MAPCRVILVLPELEKDLVSTGIADCRYFLGRVWTGPDGSWLKECATVSLIVKNHLGYIPYLGI